MDEQEALEIGRDRLLDLIRNGGKAKRQVKCRRCGNSTSVDIDIIDPVQHVRALEYFDKLNAGDKRDSSTEADNVLQRIRDMSDDELADAYVRSAVNTKS